MHLQTFSLLLQRMWQKDSTSLLYGLFGENSLQPLPDNVFCCSVEAHYSSALKATNSSYWKTRWDADGPNEPDIEPNSMPVLLGWWTTKGSYSKYHGGKDHSGQSKEVSAKSIGSKIFRI
jgi:hypothetical protein